jgi:CelD/BcsL family acetyltransferase involved in cellulose biosynthesis
MKIRVFPFDRLSHEHLDAWSAIQLANCECESPYFRPEFHQLAAAAGRPVMVAVMEAGDRPVGFFPFEKGNFGTALPVAAKLSDFHGAIVAPGTAFSASELLRACGLRRFKFDHLLETQRAFITAPVETANSLAIDLTSGFDVYRNELKRRGQKELERTIKKRNKLEKELGPVRFCIHEPSPEATTACLNWKSAQYERTGALNVFRTPWVVDLLGRIASSAGPYFFGAVSTLYVGDELVAVHVGMRTASVLHHWFPAHDAAHPGVKHSPGLQLLAAMIEDFAAIGIRRIDFGTGEYGYKQDFANANSRVVAGTCGPASLGSAVSRSLQGTKTRLRNAAQQAGLETPLVWYRQMRDWLAMR